MSTNHTPNYDLCQWEAGDKVLHTDFNEDNQKVDRTLALFAARLARRGNCRIEHFTYTGNGSPTGYLSINSLYTPVFLVITGGGCITIAARGLANAQCWDSRGNYGEFPVSWKEHGVQWAYAADKLTFQGNIDGIDYQRLVLFDMEN